MPRTIDTLPTPAEACSRILDLAGPLGPIEVSLVDALGLVLAEPAVADVDLPPFDRASCEGYAVRAGEATAGGLLRVVGLRWAVPTPGDALDPGEAIRVSPGDAIPVGADAVVRPGDVRADPETGPTRVIEVVRAAESGQDVARRGLLLEAGAVIAPEGTRLRTAMVGLLASQGCVHPTCHRRVRVAVLAVGDHLVGPAEAPVMHRERNWAGAAIVAMAARAGAMPHDLQAVPGSQLPASLLDRATSAPVVVVLGPSSRATRRAFRSIGVEPVVSGVAMRPGGPTRHGVIRDAEGRADNHVFHLPMAPLAASAAFALLVHPLIARLQGGPPSGPRTVPAVLDGPHRATGHRSRVVPVALGIDALARHRARPVDLRGPDDLPGLARADGLAVLPARSGPWAGGEVVEVVRFDP